MTPTLAPDAQAMPGIDDDGLIEEASRRALAEGRQGAALNPAYLRARPTDAALYAAAMTWAARHAKDWDWGNTMLTVRRAVMGELNDPLAAGLIVLVNQRLGAVRAALTPHLPEGSDATDAVDAVVRAVLFGEPDPPQ